MPPPGSGHGGPAVPRGTAVLDQLRAEIAAMLRHALATGREVPPVLMRRALASLEVSGDPAMLSAVHAQMAARVAPARPGTLCLMQAAGNAGPLSLLGPVRNVRWLTLAALFCLIAFMLTTLSPLIDGDALTKELFELDGLQQLTVTTLLLTSAGLGATFQALFTAQTYISRATYDPLYDASYWVRIGLGLVAGLMLAMLIPMEKVDQAGSLQRPLLALLGGFSARLTHRVLQRLVDTVDSMFDSDRRQLVEQTQAQSQSEARQTAMRTRMALARQLMGVQGEILAAAPDDAARQRLAAMLDDLLAGTPPPDDPGGATPSGESVTPGGESVTPGPAPP